MPVLREKKLIFVHVPKTGGSAIERALGLHPTEVSDPEYYLSGSKVLLQHLDLRGIVDVLERDGEDMSLYNVVGVVREPVSRFLSEYRWRKKIGHKIADGLDVNQFADKVYTLWQTNAHMDSHLVTQESYFNVDVTTFSSHQIFKFEEGLGGIAASVAGLLDRPKLELKLINSTDPEVAKPSDLTESSLKKLHAVYASDFEAFY
ncbi:MAG: hypothetical protein GJ677_02465 [Rhodobacteraceae bacterium]|nr:hypothetical protein [Paracoccaceae bacterium]